MTSIVSICNMALSHVGARATIASMDEQSTEAMHCRAHYTQVRDEALRAHRWSFAARREALADLGTPPTGWAFRYAIPSDCLLAREIVRQDRRQQAIPFRLESSADAGGNAIRVLLTDEPNATLLYTARVADPALYDPSFVSALSWMLAARIALPLGAAAPIQQQAIQMAQAMLYTARANDASEDGAMVGDHTPAWIDARGTGAADWWS